MCKPKDDDLIIGGDPDGTFVVREATTLKALSGPLPLDQAVDFALAYSHVDVWQQQFDARGRPLDEPCKLLARRRL